MTLGWFPTVKKCCFCVENLRIASALIAVYSVIVGLTSFDVFTPACSNVYVGASGIMARVAGGLSFVAGLAIAVVSIILIIGIMRDNPNGDNYVIVALVRIAAAIIYRGLLLISMAVKEFHCDDPLYEGLEPKFFFISTFFFEGLLYSLLMLYFAVVVNSVE